MKNPSTIILAKLSIAALLSIPSLASADMDELIELQREQLAVQKEILDNQEMMRLQGQWMEPSRNEPEPSYLDREIERQRFIDDLRFQARKEAERNTED